MVRHKRRQRVAIIDDDTQVRLAVKNLLESNGVQARGFASAEAFLRSPSSHSAGCLIVDFHLPGMNGRELQQALEARAGRVPVIFVSADPQQLQPDHSALAVLPKPFDPDELMRLVRLALQIPPQP
jgi:FixJ family two-component response regulator